MSKNKIPAVPEKKVKLVDIENEEVKQKIEAWATYLRSMKYIEVMTYYDSVELWGEDDAGDFALWIIYFTSPGTYQLSKEFDLFCGLSGNQTSHAKYFHSMQIKWSQLKKLPKLAKNIREELFAAFGDGVPDLR